MIKIGAYNELKIIKQVDFGFYLDGFEEGEILLPRRYATDEMQIGDTINVFLYFDSEDRLIATTQRAKAEVNKFASLKVIDTNRAGAFLDWGLPKDLLVPFNQQKIAMKEGYGYVVYVYQDDISERLVASSKLDRFLDIEPANYSVGDKVDLLIADKTDIGFKAIINNKHWGVLFESEVFGEMGIGKQCKGYIKQNQGFLPLHDKSTPQQIAKILKMSKANFKKSIGQLYRKKLITIENNGIRINE